MPDFAIEFPYRQGTQNLLPLGGTPIWTDTPEIRVWGEPHRHELRTVACPLGRVALFGDCFVDDQTLQATTDDAICRDEPQVLTHFSGSYATVLLEATGRLTVLTSTTGVPSLYYKQTEAGITVSTRPTLLAGASGLSPRGSHIAMYMLAPGHGSELLLGEQSCFDGIMKLGGSRALRVTSQQPTRVYDYEILAPDSTVSLDYASQIFRNELEAAIASRFNQGVKVSADFSGGLDSTSIAFLAARHAGERLLSVFFADVPDPMEGGDRAYARRLAILDERLDFRTFVLSPPSAFTLQDFLQTPRPEELNVDGTTPDGWLSIRNYYEQINRYAGHLHLTGAGGDEVLSGGIAYLAEVLRTGQLKRFLQETTAFARIYNMPPRILGATVAELAFNPTRALERTARILRNSELKDNLAAFGWLGTVGIGQPVGSGIRWLTKGARQELADIFAAAARTMRLPNGFGIGDYLVLERIRTAAAGEKMTTHFALAAGVDFSLQSPLLDTNVVRAAISAAARLKGSPYDFKSILQSALEGVIPAEVLARRSKGNGDTYFCRILSNSRQTLRAIAQDSWLADMGIIDPSKVLETIGHIDTMSVQDAYALGRLLSAELWLRNYAGNRSSVQHNQQVHLTTPSAPALPGAEAKPNTQASNHHAKARLVVPENIYAVSSNTGCLVLLNQQTNKYHTLDRPQSDILRALAETGDVGQTLEQFAARYPTVDSQVLLMDIIRCTETFQSLGLITESDILPHCSLPEQPREPRFVSAEWIMARNEVSGSHAHTRIQEHLLTLVGRGIDELLSHGNMDKLRMPLLQRLQQRWCNREASYQEAQSLLRNAQQLPWIGRVACREAAYTAALTAALGRKVVSYHLGVSFQPLSFHAWIEAEGRPVRTEYDGKVVGSFQSFFA